MRELTFLAKLAEDIDAMLRGDRILMALFQISEPGEAPAPHQRKRAIGIDLGTTNSLVATVRNGLAVVLPDDEGRPLVPSIVRYGEDGVETGYAAMAHQTDDPQNTIVSVKRLMGRGLADLADARRFPYRFVDAPGMVKIAHARGREESRSKSPRTSCGRCASAPKRRSAVRSTAPWSPCPRISTTRSGRRPRTRRSSRACPCCAC